MAFAFDVVSGVPRITQTGTDANLGGMATAINAVATVARSTAVAAGAILRPPAANGLWYRCTTAGTTAATAPLYNTVEGGSTTDGTAVFNAFLAPVIRTIAGGNHYYMPSVRVQINGTLTNANPQQNTFTCFDVEMSGGNWTSGAYASDGVTPLWNGLHFCAMRQGSAGAEESDGGLRLLSGAQFTFIGGEVQVGGSIVFNSGTTPRTYQTRWRNSREFGASSARIRNKTANAIFSQVELFDIAFDLFVMPTTAPSIKARGSEYLYQYVGSPFGGADARFVALDLENPSGQFDFDNFGSGWVELYNCKAGAALRVVTQHPSSTFWVRHCVPLYQDLVITARDTAGAVVPDVRFTATEAPSNPPTVTFSTQGNLKVWDFRSPTTYQATTNASGVALSSPVLNVWYWQTTFRQSLRFPASTATYEGRAYGYKSTTVSVVLGASAAIPVSAGMVARDTATVLTRAAALAQTGITFTPSGATGGTVSITGSRNLQQVWDYYNAWIIEFANRTSTDTWTCVGEILNAGAWSFSVPAGSELLSTNDIESLKTTGTVTNAGTIDFPFQDADGLRATVTGLDPEGFGITWFLRHRPVGGSTWTNISGTGNTALVLLAPGSYDMQVRAPGYEWESALLLNTEVSLSLNAGLRYQVSANNTPQYTMIYDAVLEAIFQYDATAMKVSVENETGSIIQPGFAELYQATQRIQHIPALVWTWTAPVTANATSQKILIPTGNPISMYLTDDSNATVKITCPVIHADTGQSADDRVRGNPAGYSIILGSPATAESAGLAAQIISGLGGAGYTESEASQTVLRNLIDQVQALVEQVKSNTDTIPDQPAATASAVWNEALTGATHNTAGSAGRRLRTLADTVILIEGTGNSMSNAGGVGAITLPDASTVCIKQAIRVGNQVRYVKSFDPATKVATTDAPWCTVTSGDVEYTVFSGRESEGPSAEEIATQVEVAIINDDDGRAVLQAIADKVMAEEITSTVIAQSVRAELATELARIDAPISSRSTLQAADIPEGLTAEEVWAYTDRELTSAAGMTPEQAEELGEVVANTRATFASVNKLTQ
jgi:hypothetical protein